MHKMLSLESTFGWILLGTVCSSALLGLILLQSIIYFLNYHRKDSWRLLALVTAILIIEFVHQIIITHAVYFYSITSWGNSNALQTLVWSIIMEVPFTGLSALIVQTFLVRRIWHRQSWRYLDHGFKHDLGSCRIWLCTCIYNLSNANEIISETRPTKVSVHFREHTGSPE